MNCLWQNPRSELTRPPCPISMTNEDREYLSDGGDDVASQKTSAYGPSGTHSTLSSESSTVIDWKSVRVSSKTSSSSWMPNSDADEMDSTASPEMPLTTERKSVVDSPPTTMTKGTKPSEVGNKFSSASFEMLQQRMPSAVNELTPGELAMRAPRVSLLPVADSSNTDTSSHQRQQRPETSPVTSTRTLTGTTGRLDTSPPNGPFSSTPSTLHHRMVSIVDTKNRSDSSESTGMSMSPSGTSTRTFSDTHKNAADISSAAQSVEGRLNSSSLSSSSSSSSSSPSSSGQVSARSRERDALPREAAVENVSPSRPLPRRLHLDCEYILA